MSSLNAEIEKIERTLEKAEEEDNYKTHRSAMIKSAASLMDEDEKKQARKAFETEDEKKDRAVSEDDHKDEKFKVANTEEQMKSIDTMVKEIEKQARAHFASIEDKSLEELLDDRKPEKPLAASDKQIKFEDMWN